MLTFLRILLFSLSILGYILGTKRWLNISSFSSYIFVFSSIAIVIFFGGMISLLELSVYVVFVVGLILFFFFFIKEGRQRILTIKSLSIINIAFVLVVTTISIVLLHTKFIHYDNFSHWGTVVKYMLSANAFPDLSTTLIEFVDYPLGASAFIYYVCKIVGNSQGIMLFGQGLLIFACFYAMFGIINEQKRHLLYVVLALSLCATSFFNLAIRMNNLLVDFLLPVLALAAIAVIYSNRNHFYRACIIVAPILGLLSVVKNTGIFFVVTCLGYLIFIAAGQYNRGENSKNIKLFFSCCSTIVLSMVPMFIWKAYFNMRFGGIDTKFNISQTNLEQVASTKTIEQIQEIIQIFLTTIMDMANPVTVGFLIINILGIIACLVAKYGIKKKWYLWKVLLLTNMMVIIYYIGLLGMYIFLMPIDEALRIAGFERYVCSIIIYQIGCLSLCLTLDIERSFHIKMGDIYNPRGFKSIQTKNLYQKATVICIVFSVMILTSEINGLNYIKDQYEDSLPGRVSAVIEENKNSPNEDSYLVYASNNEEQISSYYLQYIFRYMLFTHNVDAIDTVFNNDFVDKLKTYDFLVVFESDKKIEYILKKNFGTVVSQGIYKIEGNKLQYVMQQ